MEIELARQEGDDCCSAGVQDMGCFGGDKAVDKEEGEIDKGVEDKDFWTGGGEYGVFIYLIANFQRERKESKCQRG